MLSVSEYLTKNEEDAKFEAHHKYIDIQYVINGAEQMSITPLSEERKSWYLMILPKMLNL